MSAGYRDTALACPGCGDRLDPKQVDEAVIDVCPACGGIWVDWFDGELVRMVRGAPPAQGARAPERAGSSACPRCQVPLAGERYQESRAEILRCGDCSGAFVPRGSAQAVAGLDADEHPRAPEGPWSRLAAVLARWLGWEENR